MVYKGFDVGSAKPKKEIDYDLVGLGGLIMGSKNLSDLGMGFNKIITLIR